MLVYALVACSIFLLIYLFAPHLALLLNLLNLVNLLFTIKLKSFQIFRGNPDWSVVDLFEECVDSHADKPAIIVADSKNSYTISYADLDEQANRVCHWAKRNGLKKGATVAVLMPSCVDFVAVWLGLAKIGISSALINNTLPGKALLHAILTALKQEGHEKKEGHRLMLIANFSLWKEHISETEVQRVLSAENIDCVMIGGEEDGYQSMDADLCAMSTFRPPPSNRRGISSGDVLFYVYTSGTTGFPKASKIHHFRFWMAGCVIRVLCRLTSKDRLYCALPLYHAAGGVMGLSACFQSGATLVLRPKFSASAFAQDITLHRCTVMQYIGEMARYLTTCPKTKEDGMCGKTLRRAIGNGMRPDVWVKFQKRYKIKKVIEFYASTEGNTNIFNNAGKVGAIGVVPWFASFLYPVNLIRCDSETHKIIRGENGLCIPCRPGEPGQVVGLIRQGDPMRHFNGYTDKDATSKKVIQNVFRHGDQYFLSGDLLQKDSFGFFYWVDRVGDTFRWKGENVSTSQVAQIMANFPSILEANVYGVEVPGCEGRAGMAAVTLQKGVSSENLKWQELMSHLDQNLPKYAQPVFLRIQQSIELTSTFKYKKNDLQKEGFIPQLTGNDQVFYLDSKTRSFDLVTPEVYQKFIDSKIRL